MTRWWEMYFCHYCFTLGLHRAVCEDHRHCLIITVTWPLTRRSRTLACRRYVFPSPFQFLISFIRRLQMPVWFDLGTIAKQTNLKDIGICIWYFGTLILGKSKNQIWSIGRFLEMFKFLPADIIQVNTYMYNWVC